MVGSSFLLPNCLNCSLDTAKSNPTEATHPIYSKILVV